MVRLDVVLDAVSRESGKDVGKIARPDETAKFDDMLWRQAVHDDDFLTPRRVVNSPEKLGGELAHSLKSLW